MVRNKVDKYNDECMDIESGFSYTSEFSEDGTVATGTFTVASCSGGHGSYEFIPPLVGTWKAYWLQA